MMDHLPPGNLLRCQLVAFVFTANVLSSILCRVQAVHLYCYSIKSQVVTTHTKFMIDGAHPRDTADGATSMGKATTTATMIMTS